MAIPRRVDQRLMKVFQKYRAILEEARNRDVNEADTVTIVKGLLAEAFGWDPFFEVTAEYSIRGTYVDLAVKTDSAIGYLIEVKAIGADLRENHLRQAVSYAANEGIEWVVLTNAVIWQAYRVNFGKPVTHELVFQLDLLNDNPKDSRFREMAFLLTKEGMTKAAISRFHAQRQAMSRFNIAAILRGDPVVSVVRRELRRAFPKLKASREQIRELIEAEVLKREVVEGDKAQEASRTIRRASRPSRRGRSLKQGARRSQEDSDLHGTAAVPSEPQT